MIDWLVTSDSGYAFEVVGNRLLAYGRRKKAVELPRMVGALTMFRDRVPRVAWTMYPVAG